MKIREQTGENKAPYFRVDITKEYCGIKTGFVCPRRESFKN